jgi:hypothetical protein
MKIVCTQGRMHYQYNRTNLSGWNLSTVDPKAFNLHKCCLSFWVRFLFMCLCFIDLITAIQILQHYTGKEVNLS